MDHALPLRHHLLACFEAADHEGDEATRRRLLTFVIVGGGPTGVEYAGALAELIHGPLLEDYPRLRRDEVGVLLLEARDGLLAGMPARLGRYAVERLHSRHVNVRTGAVVTRVTADAILVKGEPPIPTETVVWTAGVQGDPRLGSWGLPVVRGGRVEVGPPLNLRARPEVWIAGDLAWVEQDGALLPQVAPVAMQEGERVAENILRTIRRQTPVDFRYRDPGMLAVIGRNAAVADFGGRTFQGFPAWVLWLLIHIAKLIGFRNRALVLVNWAWNYLRYRRAVRLILSSERRGLGSFPT
jgi:NADH dehydrogenase